MWNDNIYNSSKCAAILITIVIVLICWITHHITFFSGFLCCESYFIFRNLWDKYIEGN